MSDIEQGYELNKETNKICDVGLTFLHPSSSPSLVAL